MVQIYFINHIKNICILYNGLYRFTWITNPSDLDKLILHEVLLNFHFPFSIKEWLSINIYFDNINWELYIFNNFEFA